MAYQPLKIGDEEPFKFDARYTLKRESESRYVVNFNGTPVGYSESEVHAAMVYLAHADMLDRTEAQERG